MVGDWGIRTRERSQMVCERWSRLTDGRDELIYGPGLAASSNPAAQRLARLGAHFNWVASPIGPRSFWDLHVGIVLAEDGETAVVGAHVRAELPDLAELLASWADLLVGCGLEKTHSARSGEWQWNSQPMPLGTSQDVDAVCGRAEALWRRVIGIAEIERDLPDTEVGVTRLRGSQASGSLPKSRGRTS